MEYLHPILGKSDVEDFTEVGEEMSESIGSDLPLPLSCHRIVFTGCCPYFNSYTHPGDDLACPLPSEGRNSAPGSSRRMRGFSGEERGGRKMLC